MSENPYGGFPPPVQGRMAGSDPRERMAHHERLTLSIDRLEQVERELLMLLARIHHGAANPTGGNEEAREEPTLHGVLTEGPKRIDEITVKMRETLAEIREALF